MPRARIRSRTCLGTDEVLRLSRFIRARSRTLRVVSGFSVDEDERCHRNSLIPRLGNWKPTEACLKKENKSSFFEARWILYVVWHAENRYSPERPLILSDNLALVLTLCKRRSTPSELNYSDQGSRFFDRDQDQKQIPSSCTCATSHDVSMHRQATHNVSSLTDAAG